MRVTSHDVAQGSLCLGPSRERRNRSAARFSRGSLTRGNYSAVIFPLLVAKLLVGGSPTTSSGVGYSQQTSTFEQLDTLRGSHVTCTRSTFNRNWPIFTTPGVHPYDEVAWEVRDSRITNWRDGTVAFEQLGVEFPMDWSLNSTNIVTQKYFRGTPDTPEREHSVRQVIDRVADTISTWGIEGGYFADQEEAEAFRAELKFILVTQRAAFQQSRLVQHWR